MTVTNCNKPPVLDERQSELVELLRKKGKSGLDDWRQRYPSSPVVLRGVELPGIDMSGVDLTRADLRQANFAQSRFRNACLQGANLEKANLHKTDFSDCRLENASLAHAEIEGAVFSHGSLMNAHFDGARLRNASFANTSVMGATFESSDLSYADFTSADLSGSNFTGATLWHAVLKDVNGHLAVFSEASLIDCNCEKGRFRSAHFDNADLSHANLSSSDCSQGLFKDADLTCASLRDGRFELADMDGARIVGTDLSGADLRRCILTGSTLFADSSDGQEPASLQYDEKTDLTGVGLGNARIEPNVKADFEYNIRRLYWHRKYTQSGWDRAASVFWRPFWSVTDYGRSTEGIAITFMLVSFLFSLIYLVGTIPAPNWWPEWATSEPLVQNLAACKGPSGAEIHVSNNVFVLWCRSMYFSIVTMTGFGDITANPENPWGYFWVALQVLIGYVLLGCFVTRLAILFQSVR